MSQLKKTHESQSHLGLVPNDNSRADAIAAVVVLKFQVVEVHENQRVPVKQGDVSRPVTDRV